MLLFLEQRPLKDVYLSGTWVTAAHCVLACWLQETEWRIPALVDRGIRARGCNFTACHLPKMRDLLVQALTRSST